MAKSIEELAVEAPDGAFSSLDMEVLVPEVQQLYPGETYLEIGVDKGRSLWVAKQVAYDGVIICGVDVADDPQIAGTQFYKGHSFCVAQKWHSPISVLFIDGDHSYKACKMDLEAWTPHLVPGGVILFHDCDESSPGVLQAVAEFVNERIGQIAEFKIFKREDKNTSMALVRLT